MTVIPSLKTEPTGDAQRTSGDSHKVIPVTIPWGAYYVVYFVQAVIMSMVLTNVPVFLKRGLLLEWLWLTTSFALMVIPVLLRPLFALIADRRPVILSSFLVGGVVLVIAGSLCASLAAPAGPDGIGLLTGGFATAVVGTTLMNVAADSHIVRAVPLDQSARVNSRKRLFAFLGIALGQGCSLLIVGSDFTNLGRWTLYFAVPGIAATVTYMIYAMKRGWRLFLSVEGLPRSRAPWLNRSEADAKGTGQRSPKSLFGVLLVIAFLFMVPDGLIEATFENFLVATYCPPPPEQCTSWLVYSGFMVLGILLGAIGYALAGRSGKRAPEWDIFWYVPVIAAFDTLLWAAPPFPLVLWPAIAIQVPAAYIQVRLLQSWQSHAFSRRPALTFQVFVATYQLGKIAGIGISGIIMTVAGYATIFAGTVVTWGVVLVFAIAYHVISRR